MPGRCEPQVTVGATAFGLGGHGSCALGKFVVHCAFAAGAPLTIDANVAIFVEPSAPIFTSHAPRTSCVHCDDVERRTAL